MPQGQEFKSEKQEVSGSPGLPKPAKFSWSSHHGADSQPSRVSGSCSVNLISILHLKGTYKAKQITKELTRTAIRTMDGSYSRPARMLITSELLIN